MSTPVSMMAMIVPGSPLAASQAAVALMSAPAVVWNGNAGAEVEEASDVPEVVLVAQEIGVVGDIGQAGPVVGPGQLDVAVAAEHGQGLRDGHARGGPHAVDPDPRDATDGGKAVGSEESVGVRFIDAGAEADEDAVGGVAGEPAADGRPLDAQAPDRAP